MRLIILLIILGLMINYAIGSESIQLKTNKNYVVLKADQNNANTKVLALPNLINGKESMATFEVTYNGFSSQAQTAFQYAVNIWASIISSSVPIRVEANWDSLGPQVLGSASAATFISASDNTFPQQNTWYPIALAEKLMGSNHNQYSPPDSADIKANFNSNFSQWYFGTDGNCPAGRFDFVTVVLHELCHGLGFQGSMNISGGQGSWGFGSGNPFIYDHFTENGSGQALLNTSIFPNPSQTLANVLTGNNVFFNGPISVSVNGFVPVKLYAPASWDGSSSYSHLNETTYPPGNINSLMTPTLSASEVIHHPGNITLGMFEDMGWTTNLVVNTTSVFPGDTDDNGIVDALDILPIGVHFLAQGTQRQNISFTWEAQEATVWSNLAATYADANGDGIVDEKDIIGIGVNWGKSYTGNVSKPVVNYNDPDFLMPYRDNFKIIYNSLSGQGKEVLEIKQLLNSVFEFEENFPGFFSLEQNYPNPFNPSTYISFVLPETQEVNLNIYNTRGQIVAEVIKNKLYETGIHNMKFDASNLPNGVYIYSLKTEKYNQSRKMIVVK